MTTQNVSTLKIHKLTQAQYDRELEAGNIEENALYLTPAEEYATKQELDALREEVEALKAQIASLTEVITYLNI